MKPKFIVFFLFLLVVSINTEAQCAMCRAVLESEEGQETAKGINDGIVYLMMIPYVLMGVVGYFIYRGFKKSKSTEVNKS